MRQTVTSLVTAGFLLSLAVPVGAWAKGDQAFLRKAMEGDNSEIALGHMAEQKGASTGTRDFGRMLVQDHTQARTQALPVAQAHGLSPTEVMQPEAVRERHKLADVSGQAFDREFARYMVQDHKKDISDFAKAAATGDATTAALARKNLPVLRKHLATAEKLESETGGKGK